MIGKNMCTFVNYVVSCFKITEGLAGKMNEDDDV
jgi:hypothetical protein